MKAVILAGGTGSRLWPLSRKSTPKQFQKLTGNKTMLQETIERIGFLKPADIYISTNGEYKDIVIKQSRPYKIPLKNIIVEPALRDTAPCIGLAALYVAKINPNEVMSIIYADHLIQNKTEFVEKLKIAEKIALKENTLNIIEVKAKFPNVNLGYVKIGKPLKEIGDTEIYSFEGFTEKPTYEKARKFLQSYKYLWNTGYYVWKAGTILNYYKTHQPNTYKHLSAIKKALGTKNESKTIEKHYPLCDKISIDYGIMEKVDPKVVRIIPAELGWSDVGTWESIMEELPRNKKGNLVKAAHLGIDSSNTLIYGNPNKLIATIGVDNLVIVDTKDALLVCRKDRSQDVKKLVEKLKTTKYKNLT